MNEFKIIKLSNHRDMVIFLTMDVSRDTLMNIESELYGREENKTIVYFDFLMSNGMSNRFFYTSLSRLKNHGSLKTCTYIPRKYVELSDSFFEDNFMYLESSVLSNKQKRMYRERLVKNYISKEQ